MVYGLSSSTWVEVAGGAVVNVWIEATTGAAAEVHQSMRLLTLAALVLVSIGSVESCGVSSIGGKSLCATITASASDAMIAPNCCVRCSAWPFVAFARKISLRSHLLSAL